MGGIAVKVTFTGFGDRDLRVPCAEVLGLADVTVALGGAQVGPGRLIEVGIVELVVGGRN